MKKIKIFLTTIFLTSILLSSCGSHQKCDAYSSKHRDKTEVVRY